MKVLVINGSPKGERSNTMNITRAFLRGMSRDTEHEIRKFTVRDHHIEYCRGCFFCWNNPNGACIIRDDMRQLLDWYKWAEVVIYSAPIYTFGMNAMMKNVFDRMLPRDLPVINEDSRGGERHPNRWDESEKKLVYIATCGFYSYENNVEPLLKQLEIMYGSDVEIIICPEGGLFSCELAASKTSDYLKSARQAGYEFVTQGEISEETHEVLTQRTFGIRNYLQVANNSWGKTVIDASPDKEKRDALRRCLRIIAALADYQIPDNEQAVLEFVCPDVDFSAQLICTPADCKLIENADEFVRYDLRLRCPSMRIIKNGFKREMVNGEYVPNQKHDLASPNRLMEWTWQSHKKGKQREIQL